MNQGRLIPVPFEFDYKSKAPAYFEGPSLDSRTEYSVSK